MSLMAIVLVLLALIAVAVAVLMWGSKHPATVAADISKAEKLGVEAANAAAGLVKKG